MSSASSTCRWIENVVPPSDSGPLISNSGNSSDSMTTVSPNLSSACPTRPHLEKGSRPGARCVAAGPPAASAREQLRGIAKRLELERVAGRIAEEHRRLLADLAVEAHVGLDHERGAAGA